MTVWKSFTNSLSDMYSIRDEESKGRLISLGSAMITAFYNVFITGIFYTGFCPCTIFPSPVWELSRSFPTSPTVSAYFHRGFWDGYYQGARLGEWSTVYGNKATRKKTYIGINF